MLQPKEQTDGHEDAATGDPRTLPFTDPCALPKRALGGKRDWMINVE